MKLPKILIVDDDPAVRKSLAYYFEDRDWEPLSVSSAEEALVLLASESPKAAIVNIRLAGMNGDTFIREAHLLAPSLVFVICTGSLGYRTPEDISVLPEMSSRVFEKPVSNLDDLGTEVCRMVDTRTTDQRK